MNRRDFLRLGLGNAVGSLSWDLLAVPSTEVGSKFLLIFLRGGYDSLSALVPYKSAFYYESRPNIAISAPQANNNASAFELDADWALHPSMKDSLLPFWESRQLAFVPFSGTDFGSRSHFQAQDQIELGTDFKNQARVSNGFLNRLLSELGSKDDQRRGISFSRTLPLAMRGAYKVANSPINGTLTGDFEEDFESALLAMYSRHALGPMVNEGVILRRQLNVDLQGEMQSASRGAPPSGGFPLVASNIGRFMRERPSYSVGFIEIGGWDTHVRQGAAEGLLANRLRAFALGLENLADALGPEWERTTVVVISEFGRTFLENGAKGTDHGHGSTIFLLGGGISGGRVLGRQTALTARTIQSDRETPVLNEYRSILAGLFQTQYGLGSSSLNAIFPNVVPAKLGII